MDPVPLHYGFWVGKLSAQFWLWAGNVSLALSLGVWQPGISHRALVTGFGASSASTCGQAAWDGAAGTARARVIKWVWFGGLAMDQDACFSLSSIQATSFQV